MYRTDASGALIFFEDRQQCRAGDPRTIAGLEKIQSFHGILFERCVDGAPAIDHDFLAREPPGASR